MDNVLIVVGARLNSSRLPAKHLLPLAGKPLIERVFERLDPLPFNKVLATTNDEYNRPLISWASVSGIKYFAYPGDVNDLVGRVNSLVELNNPEYVIYICGDCPLIDPQLISQGLNALALNPSTQSAEAQPDSQGRKSIHEGIHIYNREGWDKLFDHSNTELFKEHIGLAASEKQILSVVHFPLEEKYYSVTQRVSIDTAADWRFMNQLYEDWYKEHQSTVSLDWALKQFKTNPTLTNINHHVTQKSGLKKYGKLCIVTEAGPEKGLGQLTRSVELAQRFCELTGLGVELLIIGEAQDNNQLRLVNHSSFKEEIDCWEFVKKKDFKIILFDIFPTRLQDLHFFETLLQSLAENQVKLFGLDQMAKLHPLLDFCIIPNIFNPYPRVTTVVSGLEYVIVPQISEVPAKVDVTYDCIILTGGSDVMSYSLSLAEDIDASGLENQEILWIQGPFAPTPVIPAHPKNKWTIIQSPKSVPKLIQAAKRVITVCGTTIFQARALGKETWVLPADRVIPDHEYKQYCKIPGCRSLDPKTKTYDFINTPISIKDIQNQIENGAYNCVNELLKHI
ncbi:cytidylyltransferase domain-containing protein [Neptuniibacter sp. QD48_55]|uniref:cytidylyltransferase domain-containing protein n=1 Tax=Neptuniibacter sp. QD48_55 TaxID=3398212 RepID=UPI0039F61FF6